MSNNEVVRTEDQKRQLVRELVNQMDDYSHAISEFARDKDRLARAVARGENPHPTSPADIASSETACDILFSVTARSARTYQYLNLITVDEMNAVVELVEFFQGIFHSFRYGRGFSVRVQYPIQHAGMDKLIYSVLPKTTFQERRRGQKSYAQRMVERIFYTEEELAQFEDERLQEIERSAEIKVRRNALSKLNMAEIRGLVSESDHIRNIVARADADNMERTKMNQPKAELIGVLIEREFGTRY